MSHISKVLRDKSGSIILVLGMDRGVPCYHYLLVHPGKKRVFTELAGTHADLTEYGVIIESGYGEPSQQVRHKMKWDYDFEPAELPD